MADLLRWPDWMPLPQRASYSYEVTDRRIRTDMEVGSIIRVEYDTDESKASCSLVLDAFQSAWFEAFERDVLRQGSRWFEMPLLSGGIIQSHTVRFASRPKAGVIGPAHTKYTFSLDLEKRPPVICGDVASLVLCVPREHVCETAHLLDRALYDFARHITLPDFWLEN